MNRFAEATTVPSSQQKTMEYPEKGVHTPQYIPASSYYVFKLYVKIGIEASDEEFFLAALSGENFKVWLEDEDIIDHSKRKPR